MHQNNKIKNSTKKKVLSKSFFKKIKNSIKKSKNQGSNTKFIINPKLNKAFNASKIKRIVIRRIIIRNNYNGLKVCFYY